MTARQPRQRRRRVAPAAALPRPEATPEAAFARTPLSAASRRRAPAAPAAHHRQHHVNRDYSYVHKDLLTVAGVGAVVIGFIVAMSFIV